MIARFRVDGAQLDKGTRQSGTVSIDRASGILSVRPRGRRRTYDAPLYMVAAMVVAKVIKAELAEAQRAKKGARRFGRRRR